MSDRSFKTQDLQQETTIPHKDLVKALQSLTLGRSGQKVLTWVNRTKEAAASRDFCK